MPWYSPPTRRELSLVLFALTTFVFFYNLETSLTSTSERKAGTKTADSTWDDVIYGNWTWEEQQVAENARKLALESKEPVSVSFQPHTFGSVGVNDGTLDWGDDVPATTVLKHVPGYTIMDNVFALNGTLFVVTDDPSFPSLGSIASAGNNAQQAPRPSDWQMISPAQAKETFGSFGGLIHGVSWIATDVSPSNYTLFSLWRTYATLDPSLSPSSLTLPPPRRLFFPHVPTFLGEPLEPGRPIVLRERSPIGIDPSLAKAALPTLGLLYAEDWADFALLHVPYMLRRVVVADRGAAQRAQSSADVPAFAVPLRELPTSKQWWEPIRRGVARAVGVPEELPKAGWLNAYKRKTVVTYLTRQDAENGPKLRADNHEALVKALQGLGSGFEVRVVKAGAKWAERMRALAQSTVVIGVYGEHMAECVYVPPSRRTTIMELFPPGVFVPDMQLAVGTLDVQYMAWREGRQHSMDALPPVALPSEEEHSEVPIDVGALIQAIRRIV